MKLWRILPLCLVMACLVRPGLMSDDHAILNASLNHYLRTGHPSIGLVRETIDPDRVEGALSIALAKKGPLYEALRKENAVERLAGVVDQVVAISRGRGEGNAGG
ncbi:MAG: hypothetical protein JOZ54_14045 [Acidobacteria bacterium]|nr:hypothetical protein [Acidobacteriota bacterium]